MAEKIFQAKINVNCGGSPVQVEVEARDSYSARQEIEKLWYFRSFQQNPVEIASPKRFKATISLNTGNNRFEVIVFANDSSQARRIIESRTDFKSFINSPSEIR